MSTPEEPVPAVPLVPPKLRPGDRVAVLSPSWAAPEHFPQRHEIAMARLRDELGLVPVEYPTTRRQGSPAERAADLMAAFTDDAIGAVFATIGGDDQITVLPHLDADAIRANPTAFFGYSDNTNLLNYLWQLGIAGYHGGSTMVHLARAGGIHPAHLESLRAALFGGTVTLCEPSEFSEDDTDWADLESTSAPPVRRPAAPWTWHRPDAVVTAPTWGGNLEILHWVLASGRYVGANGRYTGRVLLLETSEELPPATEVFRMLRNMGERGLLQQFPAVLVGRARATNFDRERSGDERETYRADQREAVLRAFADYHPDAMIVFDVDLGHTDPQWVLPYGGRVTVDGPARRVVAHY